MQPTARLHVSVLPWRLRWRPLRPSEVLDTVDPSGVFDDPANAVAVMAVILVLAPVLVVVFALLLLPFEVAIPATFALIILVLRFTGLVPWTIEQVAPRTGEVSSCKERNVIRAVRTVRSLNPDGRLRIRWSWS